MRKGSELYNSPTMTNAADFVWTYHIDPATDAWLIKWNVLCSAFWPGTNYRFLVQEIRMPTPTDRLGVTHRLRDAAKVSDTDVRAGKGSPIVATGTLADLAGYIASVSNG